MSGELIPIRYVPSAVPLKYDQCIIVNWLAAEIEDHAERRLPVLENLSGHRNREVHNFVKVSYENFMNQWFS